ncbi:MAG: DinB family protein [bacterium]
MDAQAYQRRMYEFLGDRDPIDVLSQTTGILGKIAAEHPAQILKTRAYDDKWTPNEILGHLVDVELVTGTRLRFIYCQDEPDIVGFDQDLWVARQRHNEREPAEWVKYFRLLRECNLYLWKQLTPADLNRAGRHRERGLETLDTMLRMEAGHDLCHIDQIERYLRIIRQKSK